jgi:urease accessory protein
VEATTTVQAGGPGAAALTIELVSGESTVTSALARSPLKLLTPRARGRSVWACTSSFGGGFVAGDQTRLDLRMGSNTRCYLGTQAATKVYRNPARRPCGHVTRAALAENALLVFAPDRVQGFAGSSYSQRQQFNLAEGAGLALLDWFTAGRVACGERWEFSRLQSRNEVFQAGERVFLDSILLDPADGALAASMRAGRFNCFAMLLLVGPPLREAAGRLLQEISARPVVRVAPLIASASPVADGVILRLAGEQVEAVGQALRQHLFFLHEFLGDDPWARKW